MTMFDELRRGVTAVAPFYLKGTPLVAYVHADSAPELATPEAADLLEVFHVRLVETTEDGIEPGVIEVARR